MSDLTAVRARAWKTRRAKYGPHGHASAYARTSVPCHHCRRLAQEIPLRTLAQVREAVEQAKRTKADKALARTMLKHGRMTDEARAWLASAYPQ